jgi:4,5:9,10-diseco-3-hydroxy-5,9,17-trioxoandrosta-1(10),2-diene-4-oate hydrolase
VTLSDVRGEAVDLAFLVSGDGSPVVLLHGLGASSGVWHVQEPELARHHRVYAIDLPGSGRSPMPPTPPSGDWAVEVVATFIEEVVGRPVTLIGHSMGGTIALLCALQRSDLVGSLVLVSTAGLGREVSLFLRVLSLPGVDRLAEFLVPRLMRHGGERWRRSIRARFARPTDEAIFGPVLDEAFEHYRRPEAVRGFMTALRTGTGWRGQRRRYQLRHRLTELAMPVLLVWGRDDRVLPLDHAVRAAESGPLELKILSRCGHSPHLEAAALFTPLLLEFLSRGHAG